MPQKDQPSLFYWNCIFYPSPISVQNITFFMDYKKKFQSGLFNFFRAQFHEQNFAVKNGRTYLANTDEELS
jgi:hypothetical protein